MKLILASASPRRAELLAQIGVVADAVQPADIDETPLKAELPRVYVARIAAAKATAITSENLILAADTTVAVGRRILAKPTDEAEAEKFLRLLSGRRHSVFTSVALRLESKSWQRTVETKVKFKHLSETEIAQYLATDEWRGKAGGYAIQGIGGAFIPSINGSYTNVVGLPLNETANLLRGAGYDVSFAGGPK